jgi:glycosyltransferase involved in cell wall biosynthesis
MFKLLEYMTNNTNRVSTIKISMVNALLSTIAPMTLKRGISIFIPDKSNNWILKKVIHHITENLEIPHEIIHDIKIQTKYRYVFLIHHSYLGDFIRHHKRHPNRHISVLYTHPSLYTPFGETAYLLKRIKGISVMCNRMKNHLSKCGINLNSLRVTQSIGHNMKAQTTNVKTNTVAVFSAYYHRKNPILILELSKILSNWNFHIYGPGWNSCPIIDQLNSQSNIHIDNPEYEDYQRLYNHTDVVLITSHLEGGPTSLIEGLATGTPCVACENGLANDLIANGINGYTFKLNEPSHHIANLIEKAQALPNPPSEAVDNYRWNNVGASYKQFFQQTFNL